MAFSCPVQQERRDVSVDPIMDTLYAIGSAWDKMWAIGQEIYNKTGSQALNSAIKYSLNTIAYDTATWLGSGGHGQKPMFITEGWGSYLKNTADNAAGTFIESLGKSSSYGKFNLCAPNLQVQVSIGLGLVQEQRPTAPTCTFSKMIKNWDQALQDKNFLNNVQSMFNPTQNDLGIALTLHQNMIEQQNAQTNNAQLLREANKGWLDVTDLISGNSISVPGYGEMSTQSTLQGYMASINKYTGNALIDAANTFLNQYALTLLKTKLQNLGKNGGSYTSPYSGNYGGLLNPEASPANSGIAGTQASLKKIIQPTFAEQSDYDILSKLSICPNPAKAGPTDCVINSKFSQAIQNKETVGQAIKDGYLNSGGIVGFDSGGTEPPYNQGYPYRSLIILRKYRILPVGWELAAQYIKDGRPGTAVTLQDLVDCYDPGDEYKGSFDGETWCQGLVDPNWVLKAPQEYCKKIGHGPEITSSQTTVQGTSTQLMVTRNDQYCADEQSCIKEKDDGSCQYYGYCTEEKRKWKFSSDACDAVYNTCQSFNSTAGQSVSYLANTLDYSNCTADNAGCSGYCTDYNPAAASMDVSVSNGSMKLNIPINTTFADTPAAFYGLTTPIAPNGNFSNTAYANSSLGIGNSNIIFYYNNTDDKVYLVFVHGATGGSAGDANFRLNITNTTGDNAQLTLMNDANGANATYNGTPPTSLPLTVTDGSELKWDWAAGTTAGSVIAMPEGDWTLTITPISWTGIGPSNWRILYEKANKVVPLALNATNPLTISKTSGNGNWLCTGSSGNKKYFNKNVETCDASAEGCHELIRTDPSAGGANYIINGGFEDNTVGQVPVVDTTQGGAADYYILGNWPLYTKSTVTVVDSTSGGQVHSGKNSVHVTYSPTSPPHSGVFYFLAPGSGNGGAVLPVNFTIQKDALYTFSAWVYVVAGGVELEAGNDSTNNWYTATSTQTGQWERVVLNLVNHNTDSFDVNEFLIYLTDPTVANEFYVDDVQLEKGDVTAYSDYGQQGVVYEKLMPDYFMKACYDTSSDYYTRIPGSTSVCDQFARYCSAAEAGCEMYTSKTTNMSIPAQVGIDNYCDAQCVGYNKYLQTATPFESTKVDRIIPKLATKCSAAAVGCDEFTNLDKLNQGGEAKEDYTYLRQCRKPDDQCASFYTWEGSNESGYQLHTYQLQQDASNEPYVYDSLENGIPCNANTYNLLVNPDCREFYNNTGQISYQYYNYTVTCSDNCHPYRKSENNIVKDVVTEDNITQADCNNLSVHAGDVYYNTATNECNFCKGNGVWNNDYQACVYMAIPNESQQCSAANVGCREFNGNQGANTQIILDDTFESGTVDGWQSDSGAIDPTQNPSNESLMLGGHSLSVSGGSGANTIYKTVGYSVSKGSAYVLSFLTNGPVNMTASLTDNAGNSTSFSPLQINPGMSGEWGYYEISMPELTHDATSSERLVITSNIAFNIDDIKLTEITDRYYLIKWGLSDIPQACLYDTLGNYVGYDPNLGCDAYTDRDSKLHYFNGFSSLCPEASVGCEEMIDTRNSATAASSTTYISTGQVNVPPDNVIYAVYDKDKLCNVGDKGCTRLGAESKYEKNAVYQDKYLKDDPDKYSSILCSAAEDGCNAWTTSDGSAYYFKDPGNETCEWRQGQSKGQVWGWYKAKVSRCDRNGDGVVSGSDTVCLTSQDCADTSVDCTSASDCGTGATCTSGTCYYSCLPDTTDHACPTDSGYPKTLGFDDNGNMVVQPQGDSTNNWVGLCPASQSSCTEYIEPLSHFSKNEVRNPQVYTPNVTNTPIPWTAVSASSFYQIIHLDPDHLYHLTVNKPSGSASTMSVSLTNATNTSLPCSVLALDGTTNNTLGVLTAGSLNNITAGVSRLFYAPNDISCRITVTGVAPTTNTSQVIVSQSVISYQLKNSLKDECNGTVDYNGGCVLFNERSISGGGASGLNYKPLAYDADIVNSLKTPTNVTGINADSNVILKVTPDRNCANWLYCDSPERDSQGKFIGCSGGGLGLCEAMNPDGSCSHKVQGSPPFNTSSYLPNNLIYSPNKGNLGVDDISNLTGYVKVGYDPSYLPDLLSDTSFTLPNSQYLGSAMTEQGNIINNSDANGVVNGNFEKYTTSGQTTDTTGSTKTVWQPDNWVTFNTGTFVNWDPNSFYVIADPKSAQVEGINYSSDVYAPDGRSFLKVESSSRDTSAESEPLSILAGRDYVISAYINTSKLSANASGISVYYDIDIIPYDANNKPLLSSSDVYSYDTGATTNGEGIIRADSGQGWHFFTSRFKVVGATQIAVALVPRYQTATGHGGYCSNVAGNNYCTANTYVYVDDVKIAPALEIADQTPSDAADTSFWYSPQSCRLYPAADSLSCDYAEADTGIRKIGWWGYCLEHDRAPGNPNACLLWYPLDIIRGNSNLQQSYLNSNQTYYALGKVNTGYLLPALTTRPATIDTLTVDGVSTYPVYLSAHQGRTGNVGYTITDIGSGHDDCTSALAAQKPECSFSYSNSLPLSSGSLNLGSYFNSCGAWAMAVCNPNALEKNHDNYIFNTFNIQSIDVAFHSFGNYQHCSDPNFSPSTITYNLNAGNGWHNGSGPDEASAVFNNNGDLLEMAYALADTLGQCDTDFHAFVVPTFNFYGSVPYEIVKTDDGSGSGVPWQTRVNAASKYNAACINPEGWRIPCSYSASSTPFASIFGESDSSLTQPVYLAYPNLAGVYDTPLTTSAWYSSSLAPNYADLQRIFAKSLGYWLWNGSSYGSEAKSYSVPQNTCGYGTPFIAASRPGYDHTTATGQLFCASNHTGVVAACTNTAGSEYDDLCGVPPQILKFTATADNLSATFNIQIKVDPDQMPLQSILIDKGDGTPAVSINIPSPQGNIYTLTDTESYDWSTLAGAGKTSGNTATVVPRIQVMDNWGWCQAPSLNAPSNTGCGSYASLNGGSSITLTNQ